MKPQDLVAVGYDEIADRFGEWRPGITGSPDDAWLDALFARLPKIADVLELGCGHGQAARRLVDAGHGYTGVDISAEQLRHARKLVPEAEFLHADMTGLDIDPESLDAVVSLYVLGHMPRADLPPLLQRIAGWLRPDGCFLATYARSGWEGVQDDFLGVPMFFGSYTDEETLDLLVRAGFEIEREEVVTIVEPEVGPGSFLWVLATRGRNARYLGPPR